MLSSCTMQSFFINNKYHKGSTPSAEQYEMIIKTSQWYSLFHPSDPRCHCYRRCCWLLLFAVSCCCYWLSWRLPPPSQLPLSLFLINHTWWHILRCAPSIIYLFSNLHNKCFLFSAHDTPVGSLPHSLLNLVLWLWFLWNGVELKYEIVQNGNI